MSIVRDSNLRIVGRLDGNEILNYKGRKVGEIFENHLYDMNSNKCGEVKNFSIINVNNEKIGEIFDTIIVDNELNKLGEFEGGYEVAKAASYLLLFMR